MKKEKFCERYPWEEFKERYVKWHEEFCFCYKNIKIWLIKDGKNRFLFTTISVTYLSENEAIPSEIYNSPEKLLENARIDGKTLQEIWDELELE